MKRTEARIVLTFNSVGHALAILDAIKPETKLPPTQRSTVKIYQKGRSIYIRFVAKDIVALRASLNATLRYVLGLSKTTMSLRELESE